MLTQTNLTFSGETEAQHILVKKRKWNSMVGERTYRFTLDLKLNRVGSFIA